MKQVHKMQLPTIAFFNNYNNNIQVIVINMWHALKKIMCLEMRR